MIKPKRLRGPLPRWAGVLLVALTLLPMTTGTTGSVVLAAPAARPTITLSPASGPPGTVLTIHGRVPEMTPAGHSIPNFTVCLGGCGAGFTDEGLPIAWTGPTNFVARFTIPRTVLLTPRGPLVLRDDVYPIGVTCLVPGAARCLSSAEAKANFRLTDAPRATRCVGIDTCGYLNLSSTTVAPGQVLRVSGWAPLAPIIGHPYPYTLVLSRGKASVQVGETLQNMSGDLTGTFRVPAIAPSLGTVGPGRYTLSLQYQFDGAPPAAWKTRGVRISPEGHAYPFETLTLAPRILEITASRTWGALGHIAVHSVQWSGALPLAAGGPSHGAFAYCVPGGIETTRDGGKSWRLISTAAADGASHSTPYPIWSVSGQPSCQSVFLDPSSPETFYATFDAADAKYGVPPLFTVLYETRDGGRSWESVRPPSGYSQADFGGIALVPAGHGRPASVVAIFGRIGRSLGGQGWPSTTRPSAIATTNGGQTWHPVSLSCPSLGPCVRFGALPGQQPGQGTAIEQPLLRSTNGGRDWTALSHPGGTLISPTAFALSQLVWLGGQVIAYVDAASQYPLRISRDGGRTWQAISLPPPPGSAGSLAEGASPYRALMLLPDGHLLGAIPSVGAASGVAWWTLAPGGTVWRALPRLDAAGIWLLAQGSRLYWARMGKGGQPTTTHPGILSAPMP